MEALHYLSCHSMSPYQSQMDLLSRLTHITLLWPFYSGAFLILIFSKKVRNVVFYENVTVVL